MNQKTKNIVELIIAVAGVFITLYGVMLFNQHLLMSFQLGVRMVLMFVTQWAVLLVPGILMWINKEKIKDLGFSKNNILSQIGIGVILAFTISLIFTVVPILLGFKDMVGSAQYTKAWQFIFKFAYAIFAIALMEELIFRGYIFKKLLQIKNSKALAIIVSSIIFGFFHIFNGNIIQVPMTAFLGALFCIFREKIKNCTTLSLIIIHGIYDGLITLWVFIL